MTPGTPRPVGIQIPSPDFQVPVPHCFSCLVAVVLLPVPPPVRKAPHIKFFQLEKILFIDLLPTDFDLVQVLV